MRIDAINLYVKNMKNMVDFYKEIMLLNSNWNGETVAEFNVDGVRLMLIERENLKSVTEVTEYGYANGLNGNFAISLDCPTFKDVDIEYERVVSLGAMPISEPKTLKWGQRVAYVADPEANVIEISSYNVFQLLGENEKDSLEFNEI